MRTATGGHRPDKHLQVRVSLVKFARPRLFTCPSGRFTRPAMNFVSAGLSKGSTGTGLPHRSTTPSFWTSMRHTVGRSISIFCSPAFQTTVDAWGAAGHWGVVEKGRG